ncbi:MAG: hypothetical protein V3V10_10490 [Planctomycetota bacterium]
MLDFQTFKRQLSLLHDVGHGPFSHAFEKVTGDKHEARTLDIIVSPDTEVNDKLGKYAEELPALIENFFNKEKSDEEKEHAGMPAFATQIVDGQFDADRADYLLRDSHATGTGYGRFDLPWILKELRYDDKRVFVGKKGFGAIEQFVFARYHMFSYCYYHKTIRATEVMLKQLFGRFRKLLREEGAANMRKRLNGIQGVLIDAFAHADEEEGGNIRLADYLKLDDGAIVEFFKICVFDEDVTLKYLARGLLDRKLYKSVDVVGQTGPTLLSLAPALTNAIKEVSESKLRGFDEQSMLVFDSPSDTPYKPYEIGRPKDQILVEVSGKGVRELSTVSEPVKSLAKYELTRYFYPVELRATIEPIAKGILKGEA